MPSVRRDLIDAPFLKMLLDGHIDLEATVKRIEARRESDLQAARDQLKAAEREIAAADARLARVQRGWQDDVLDDGDYREQRAGLLEEKQAAEHALGRHQSHVEAMERSGATADSAATLYRYLGELKQAVADGVTRAPDLRALRNTIAMIFEKVTLYGREYFRDWPEEYQPEGEYLLMFNPRGVSMSDYWGDYRKNRDAYKRPLAVPIPTGQETPVPASPQYPNGLLSESLLVDTFGPIPLAVPV